MVNQLGNREANLLYMNNSRRSRKQRPGSLSANPNRRISLVRHFYHNKPKVINVPDFAPPNLHSSSLDAAVNEKIFFFALQNLHTSLLSGYASHIYIIYA
jgi:hypothetical protein